MTIRIAFFSLLFITSFVWTRNVPEYNEATKVEFHPKDEVYNFDIAKQYVNEKDEKPIHVEDSGIHLIGWDWENMKNSWLFTAFLIIASFAKISYHHSHFLSNAIPESCILVILGLIFGGAINIAEKQHEVPKFTVKLFFNVLLPPIILESAYSLHDRAFFNNLGTILLYAIIGTYINIALIGSSLYLIEYMSFSWLMFPKISFIELMILATAISAVDPVSVLAIFQELCVNKPLYFLVFGESLLNDAVVIVVHRIMNAILKSNNIDVIQLLKGIAAFLLVSIGGLTIGACFGVITSLATLTTRKVRVVEPMIIIALAYLSFLTAEMVHWSGIISLIGCGLVQAEYAFKNISRKSYTTVKYCTKNLSSISDLLIFFFLGTMLINETHHWNTSFVIFTLIFCVGYRFVSVFSLTFIVNNFFHRLPSINIEEQILMAYGGLRGAVAFALIAVLNNEEGVKNVPLFRTTVLFIIIFTVFIMGGTTKPLLKYLRIKREEKDAARLFHQINDKLIETAMVGFEQIAGTRSINNYWTQKLLQFNQQYVKKYLTRGYKTEKIETIFKKILFEDEMEKIWGVMSINGGSKRNSIQQIVSIVNRKKSQSMAKVNNEIVELQNVSDDDDDNDDADNDDAEENHVQQNENESVKNSNGDTRSISESNDKISRPKEKYKIFIEFIWKMLKSIKQKSNI